MKKLILCFLVLAGTAFNAGAQRQAVRLTKFEGRTITHVNIRNAFTVTLSQGSDTKAVVEVDTELEPYLVFTLEGSTLTIGLNERWNNRERFPQKGVPYPHLKADLVISRLDALNVSGAVRVTGTGSFRGRSTQLGVSGASRITGLLLDTEGAFSGEISGASSVSGLMLNAARGGALRVSGAARFTGSRIASPSNFKLEVSGSARADQFDLSTIDFTVVQTGSSSGNFTLNARNLYYTGSGTSRCTLKGDSHSADFQVSGAASCNAQDLLVQDAQGVTSGCARLTLNATGTADLSASGASSIRYTGNPKATRHTSAASSIEPLP